MFIPKLWLLQAETVIVCQSQRLVVPASWQGGCVLSSGGTCRVFSKGHLSENMVFLVKRKLFFPVGLLVTSNGCFSYVLYSCRV